MSMLIMATALSSGNMGCFTHFGSIPEFGQTENGVRFSDVRPGLPAEKAGLKAGDVLIQFDEADQQSVRLHRRASPEQGWGCSRGKGDARRQSGYGVGEARAAQVGIRAQPAPAPESFRFPANAGG